MKKVTFDEATGVVRAPGRRLVLMCPFSSAAFPCSEACPHFRVDEVIRSAADGSHVPAKVVRLTCSGGEVGLEVVGG